VPGFSPRGVHRLVYSHAGIAVGPDDALVVELDHGEARLWDIQLFNRPWFESLDFANRVTNLNHALADPGPIVITGRDPGGVNWLDTEGRPEVLCTLRWWRPTGQPTVTTRVVPIADLDLPPVDRRAQVARRAAHMAWRFRT
jgi:hypothetical protein